MMSITFKPHFRNRLSTLLITGTLACTLIATGTSAEIIHKGSIDMNKPGAVINAIADMVMDDPSIKPLKRKAVKPANKKSPLYFYGQKSLTKPILESYLDQAIVHMSGSSTEPEVYGERSRQFLKDTGTKFIHWADLGWVRLYTQKDWDNIVSGVDAVHGTDWGSDIIFECGIMEAIGRHEIDNTPIPEWLLRILNDLGVQDNRKAGPNGKGYFNYEAMFDRNASDWPKNLVGLWYSNLEREQSVPGITMLETQIYYAYLIAEYIDAGFEGIMFGQTMLTGARDKDNSALNALCSFAKKWASARAYRHAVTLTSHVYNATDYPKSPASKAKPLFTHLTWPSRLSYSEKPPYTIQFGPDVKATAKRQGGEEIIHLLSLPHDLPILIEIDNFGGDPRINDFADDDITAYAAKTPVERRAFLKKYYFDSRKWKNADGNGRVHFALAGYRCLIRRISLYTLPNGDLSAPVNFYLPFREAGGEEDTIRELFKQARTSKDFPK
ncbi:MAG: hypothetical protein ACYC27_21810 [Armatimonadota bacterium]